MPDSEHMEASETPPAGGRIAPPPSRAGVRGPLLALVATVILIAVAYLAGLDDYGMWEPWEVDRLEEALAGPEEGADDGPRLGEDGEWARGPAARALSAAGYQEGATEGAVRAPAAAAAAGGLLICLLLGLALFGYRTAVFSTVILAGLPLYLIMGRLLVWSALPPTAAALVVGGAALALFGPFGRALNVVVGGVALAAGAALGAVSAGPMLGVAMPLVAAGLGLIFAGGVSRGTLGWIVTGAVVLAGVGAAIYAGLLFVDEGYLATGETGAPPTFDLYLRQLILGCFPWTGLLVVGLGVLMHPVSPGEGERPREDSAAIVLATGVAVAFVAQSMWSRLAGEAPFLLLWPLAVGAGRLLERASDETEPRRLAAAVFLLFAALGLRDHFLEPDVVLVPLADSNASLPEGWSGKLWFVVMTALVAVPTALALARGSSRQPAGSYRAWASRWLAWIVPRHQSWWRWLVPAVLVVLLLNAALTAVAPQALWYPLLSCLERRIWVAAGLLVPAGLAMAFGAKVLWDAAGLLGRHRVTATIVAGGVVVLASAHVGVPSLSRHLSSRGVAQAFEQLGDDDAPLISYRTSTRAVELLGGTKIEQESSLEEFVDRLIDEEDAFGIIKTTDLARVDLRFRKRAGGHIPVLDDGSAKLLLVAGGLPRGLVSRNVLEKVVPLERPRPSMPVAASFDDRIELIGIDVEGPGGREQVCPMDEFAVRYYWHCLRPVSGSYKIFVHVDGYGNRINGDHEPADGQYLVRDWQRGDFVVDAHHLKVPAHYRPGDYTIYVGFFQGSRRLPVSDGPATSDNRVKAGILRIR